jgi:hypothetical protein
LLTLLGGEAMEILREVGVKVGNRVTLELIKKIPGRILTAINKKVFYSFGDGQFEVEGHDALPINISDELPDLLEQLTSNGDFLGLIDRDGNTLQMIYDADDDRYWVEIPIPVSSLSDTCAIISFVHRTRQATRVSHRRRVDRFPLAQER